MLLFYFMLCVCFKIYQTVYNADFHTMPVGNGCMGSCEIEILEDHCKNVTFSS